MMRSEGTCVQLPVLDERPVCGVCDATTRCDGRHSSPPSRGAHTTARCRHSELVSSTGGPIDSGFLYRASGGARIGVSRLSQLCSGSRFAKAAAGAGAVTGRRRIAGNGGACRAHNTANSAVILERQWPCCRAWGSFPNVRRCATLPDLGRMAVSAGG